METPGSANSCEPSWCKGMSVYAPGGGYVRALTGISRIHTDLSESRGASQMKSQIFGTPKKKRNAAPTQIQCGTDIAQRKQRNGTIPQSKRRRKSSTRGFLPMCQPPAWQKKSRWQHKTGARRAQCQAKKTEKIKKVAKATKCLGKGSKNSAVLDTKWRQEAMVPREGRAHCSIVSLAKRREGLGGKSLADNPNLQLSGCRAFVLDGLKRFQDCPSSRSYRVEG